MTNRIFILSALAFGIGTARARAAAPAAASSVPVMHLTELFGELAIETSDANGGARAQDLPFIESGSIVRVLTGRAEFETDSHVFVSAVKGDVFRYTASVDKEANSGIVRIASLDEAQSPALNLKVGRSKFYVRKSAALTVKTTGDGSATVQAEGGDNGAASVEVYTEGELMASGRSLNSKKAIVVDVSNEIEFEDYPVEASRWDVERKNPNLVAVRSRRSSEDEQIEKGDKVNQAISDWPTFSRVTAELAVSRYGLPEIVTPEALTWNAAGPWMKTVIYRTGRQHAYPQKHEDIIRQSMVFEVSAAKAAALAKMDMGLSVEGNPTVISVLSDSEESNMLAMNLAHEVVGGQRTPADARAFFRKTIELSAQGKNSPYTEVILSVPWGDE